MDFYQRHDLSKVINAGGTETVLGAAPVGLAVQKAMAEILPLPVVMEDLQRHASKVISRVTGAEAGCVTACADAAIVAGLAGCMTGDDFGRIELLPDTNGLKNEVIIQRAHVTDAGGMTTLQLIRMTGAKVVEVGLARVCRGYQLESAITERTAAVLFVMNQDIPGSSLLPLPIVAEIAHDKNIPVVVDGAIIYDLSLPLRQGADLVAVSGHKMLEGPTSGLAYGCKSLVRACYLQERGIARPMKVGKESIAGVLKALETYAERDHERYRSSQQRKVRTMIKRLRDLPGIEVSEVADRHNQYMVRAGLRIDPHVSGLTEHHLARELASEEPIIKALDWLVHGGNLEFDLRYVDESELEEICTRIERVFHSFSGSSSKPKVLTKKDWSQIPYGNWPD